MRECYGTRLIVDGALPESLERPVLREHEFQGIDDAGFAIADRFLRKSKLFGWRYARKLARLGDSRKKGSAIGRLHLRRIRPIMSKLHDGVFGLSDRVLSRSRFQNMRRQDVREVGIEAFVALKAVS